MRDAIEQFKAAMVARNLIPPTDLVADGAIRRCDAEGKNGKSDGCYLLHLDGIPAGGLENHRDGIGWMNWRADMRRRLTPSEEAANQAKIDAARRKRDVANAERRAAARATAERLCNIGNLCKCHPYLSTKMLSSAYGARLHRDMLLIPLRDESGVVHSLQTIDTNGEKRFLAGGRIKGCYFSIGGKPEGTLVICEGFATGASIHEATGYSVAIAFTAGNLMAVSQTMRRKFPNLRIIIAADDDCETDGNPGLTKATEAARAISGLLAVPNFKKTQA